MDALSRLPHRLLPQFAELRRHQHQLLHGHLLGGIRWKKQVKTCADLSRRAATDTFVIVTGDAGFFGSHVFFALKKWGGAVTLPIPALLAKLLEIVAVTDVMHLAAQAGVCYANPASNVHSNVAALVNLLATCTLSSSIYRLNDKVPFSEDDHTDQLASLYAPTKKKKRWREDHPQIPPHLRPLHHPLLRRLRPVGPPGRGLLQHPPRKPINVYLC